MNYLIYVTRDAENLQFFLWSVDYSQRFHGAPTAEQRLSPSYILDNVANAAQKQSGNTHVSSSTEKIDLALEEGPSAYSVELQRSFYTTTLTSLGFAKPTTRHANAVGRLTWEAFTVQLFRMEINQIISHYIAAGSPRELNLSHKDRDAVLHALQHTTHPSSLDAVKNMLRMKLENQAHPNFIRWSICNGNKPLTVFLRFLATTIISFGFIVAVLLAPSSASRWWRVAAALEWWFGITTMIAAYKGLCVLLHRLHTRNVRP